MKENLTDTQTGGFSLRNVEKPGYISTFHLENDEVYLPNNRKTKKVKKILEDIEVNHNHSWYREIRERSVKFSNELAIFYRGNKITFSEMLAAADELSIALSNIGIEYGSEVPICMGNVPELAYIMLALNRIGAKMNSFGASFNKDYLKVILEECDKKVIFVLDECFEEIKDPIMESGIERIVLISKTRSLPRNIEKCDEYEPDLYKYYEMKDLSRKYIDGIKIISYDQFVKFTGEKKEIREEGTLDSEFLVTYTSGSTKIGFPKAIIHTNRSLIVSGRFHDSEVSGNPDLRGLRVLSLIHPDSNTCLITCISDILMQGWNVAFEPNYNVNEALDYLIINRPNYANMTSSFWNEAARQYLVDGRYSDRKLDSLFAPFAVGENIGNGEEYFLNMFLRKSKAGSGVSIKGFHLPYVTISIGGGDCEHGGIYYTLWKTLQSRLHFFKLKGKPIGMLPEKYVIATALKEYEGEWVECNHNELGVIVANSATTMQCYRNKPKETFEKLITDNKGREWVSCNVIGYIDNIGAVHVKGRAEEKLIVNNEIIYPFYVDEIADQDKKNILSSTTVFTKNGTILVNIIINPLSKEHESVTLEKLVDRLQKTLSKDIMDKIKIRVFHNISELPITASGKRNIRALEEQGQNRINIKEG